MPKIDNLKVVGIVLTILSLLWAVGGGLLLTQISDIKTELREIKEVKKEIMAIAIATAKIEMTTEHQGKQLEKIEEKLDR